MARFDVYQHATGGYLLDCQAEVLSILNTRVVVPLLPPSDGPPAIARLNPIFRISGEAMVMYTQFAASVPARDLKARAGSLAKEYATIMNAFDMLLTGY